MGFYSRQLWRRGVAEFWAEWPLFKRRFWVIIADLVFQYIHAIFTGMACEQDGAGRASRGAAGRAPRCRGCSLPCTLPAVCRQINVCRTN